MLAGIRVQYLYKIGVPRLNRFAIFLWFELISLSRSVGSVVIVLSVFGGLQVSNILLNCSQAFCRLRGVNQFKWLDNSWSSIHCIANGTYRLWKYSQTASLRMRGAVRLTTFGFGCNSAFILRSMKIWSSRSQWIR